MNKGEATKSISSSYFPVLLVLFLFCFVFFCYPCVQISRREKSKSCSRLQEQNPKNCTPSSEWNHRSPPLPVHPLHRRQKQGYRASAIASPMRKTFGFAADRSRSLSPLFLDHWKMVARWSVLSGFSSSIVFRLSGIDL